MANGITSREIFDAIHDGNADFVAAALRDHREMFVARGWTTWLSSAVNDGNLRLVQLFVEAGADVNAPESDSPGSPEGVIDTAAAEGHLEVVRWLLDHGARINHEVLGQVRCSALVHAAGSGHLEVIRLLVEHGAAVNSCQAGLTPLDHARMYGQTEVANYLRSVGGKTGAEISGAAPANRPDPNDVKTQGTQSPPRLKEGRPAVEGMPLGKWRSLFESNLPPVEQREYGIEYEFGQPATAQQIAAAEKALGIKLPADVREMLLEFNGIWTTSTASRQHGYAPDIAFLDTTYMSVNVPKYLAGTDNPLPSKRVLKKVVFVAQSNGFGDLWGVCVGDIGKHKAGAIIRLDHEVGELRACHPSFAEFIRVGRHDDSK